MFSLKYFLMNAAIIIVLIVVDIVYRRLANKRYELFLVDVIIFSTVHFFYQIYYTLILNYSGKLSLLAIVILILKPVLLVTLLFITYRFYQFLYAEQNKVINVYFRNLIQNNLPKKHILEYLNEVSITSIPIIVLDIWRSKRVHIINLFNKCEVFEIPTGQAQYTDLIINKKKRIFYSFLIIIITLVVFGIAIVPFAQDIEF